MKNQRPEYDPEIQAIANYVLTTEIKSELAYETAHYVFLDSLACSFMALDHTECTQLLGPIVPGVTLSNGAKVPGTSYQLDPVQATFNLGTMIRWLDFNDTWLAAEWGHPSDNLAAILMVSDYLNRNGHTLTLHDVLQALIKAHEIQGILALENSFNRVGLDHVVLVKVASTAVVTALLGGNHEQVCAAVSQAWVDGQSLRTYRHAPNTGARKSWAAGDAASRAVRLALLTLRGEKGYPSALTAQTWGFYDASFQGKPFQFQREYDSYVMENILFKIAFPAEFHAQTAVECAFTLHPKVKDSIDSIEQIEIETQEPGMRIINKEGPLHNYADRDHCLQYMVAIGLLFGELNANHYSDSVAKDPRIDTLRQKMKVKENKSFTQDYLDPEKRSIANSIRILFKDKSTTKTVRVDYPIGHRRRRAEGMPLLIKKFTDSVDTHFPEDKAQRIKTQADNRARLSDMRVDRWIDLCIND